MRQRGEHRVHRPLHVVARGAGSFDGNVHAPVAAPVQHIGQRQQRRRLASLARRMQHEVLLVSHQPKDFVQVDALKRRNAVVLVGLDRTRGVERTHELPSLTTPGRWPCAFAWSVSCCTGRHVPAIPRAYRGISSLRESGPIELIRSRQTEFAASTPHQQGREGENRVRPTVGNPSPSTRPRRRQRYRSDFVVSRRGGRAPCR